ncbi:hypothetical protein K435DRAFT_672306 [Dendrothele bispora CBS 962.96]|uniref:ribonuclease H n=1 Tax=Dendrothele bispora (strain CBS 962.96) TaxID=1314807 RepID=A0A4S8LTP5_DENBC|nr:hypothetical protein K435DRAFT_672306 [Dendrothele bispora CBS 962.96]
MGCTTPHICAEQAGKLLDTLQPAWNPNLPDDTNIDKRQLPETDNDTKIFKKPTPITNFSDGFRVFTKLDNRTPGQSRTPAPTLAQANGLHETVTVSTDGACFNNGETNAAAGCGIWYGHDDPRNLSLRLPQNITQSNQSGEIVALLDPLYNISKDATLVIRSDSQYTIDGLTKHLIDWEQKGYIGVENGKLFQAVAAALKQREGPVLLRKVKGHSGDQGNDGADSLAKEGALKNEPDEINLQIQGGYDLRGAQLNKLTQALAYKGVTLYKKTAPKKRRNTLGNEEGEDEIRTTSGERTIKLIKSDIKRITGQEPTDGTIWKKNTRSRNATKEQNVWTWKAIHNTFWVGSKWERIPGYEERKTCSECNETDNLQHILTECRKPGQNEVWELARGLLKRKGINLPQQLSLGLVLGCALINPCNEEGEQSRGSSRLTEIVMRESAALIWQLRNKHVIQHENDPNKIPTRTEIENRFYYRINARMQLDCTLTNKYKFEAKALSKETVADTWEEILAKSNEFEAGLPENWITTPGVLVGKETRPPGRNR